ncbi:MAG: hypothetical protein Q7S76_01525 [bacterium]|nr:hypothetical protein [bacterium]
MKNTQRGFVMPLLLALIAILLVGGIYVYENKKTEAPVVVNTAEQNSQNNPSSSTSNTAPVTAATEDANARADISATKTKVAPTASTQSTIIPVKTADEVEIHGKAAKGIILNAKIRAVEMIDGKTSGIAKEVEIDSSGDFSVSMPKPKGVILLQVVTRNGSIEKDEVLKVDVPLPLDFRFRAAVDIVDSVAKSVEVNITAYSEAAVVLAEKNGGLSPKNVNLANSGIANILGVDFLSTEIVQSNDNVRLASATQAEMKLTILNGTIASMASTDEMGCGPKQTYGETINCTIAKFADQFTLTSVPQQAHLGDVGYNAMIRHMALFKAGL